MRKDRVYTVRLCCSYDQGNSSHVPTVHVANCVCPAGLVGSCNHVTALLYALEDFVRLGLREEAALTCTQKLAQWNQPRKRKITPVRVRDVTLQKAEFRKRENRRKKIKKPYYDPRPENQRFPNPKETAALVDDLQKIQDAAMQDDSQEGKLKKLYGTSCFLRLLETSPPPSSLSDDSSSEEAGSCTSGNESEDSSEFVNTVSTSAPAPEPTMVTAEQFYHDFVALSPNDATELGRSTAVQSSSAKWHRQRGIRVTATLAKAVACRCGNDFSSIIRRKLAP